MCESSGSVWKNEQKKKCKPFIRNYSIQREKARDEYVLLFSVHFMVWPIALGIYYLVAFVMEHVRLLSDISRDSRQMMIEMGRAKKTGRERDAMARAIQ